MKAICTFCGHANRIETQECVQCGGSLRDARRERFKLPGASWLPAIPVAALLYFQHARGERLIALHNTELEAASAQAESLHQRELAKLNQDHQQREEAVNARHQAALRNERLISGAEAAERHAAEWKQRQNHDPTLAATLLERTLIEVERLGRDPSLKAEAAVAKVAELVTPRGSRVEVTEGDHGFVVRVAFRLSSVMPGEAGGGTRHVSPIEMRKEIEFVTARMIKDLFDYCGARGIQRVSVSCNRGLLTGAGETERLSLRSLYRASIESAQAATVADWRHISIGKVAALMRVDHDVISSIMITSQGRTDLALDPNEQPEF